MRRATAVQGSVGIATAGGWPTALSGTMGTAAAGAWPTALQGIMGNCGTKSQTSVSVMCAGGRTGSG